MSLIAFLRQKFTTGIVTFRDICKNTQEKCDLKPFETAVQRLLTTKFVPVAQFEFGAFCQWGTFLKSVEIFTSQKL